MKVAVRNLIEISVLFLVVIGTFAHFAFGGKRPLFCSFYSSNDGLNGLHAWIDREEYLEKLNSGTINRALVYKDLGWVRMIAQDGYRLELATTVDESFLENLKAKVASDVVFGELSGIDAWCLPQQVNA